MGILIQPFKERGFIELGVVTHTRSFEDSIALRHKLGYFDWRPHVCMSTRVSYRPLVVGVVRKRMFLTQVRPVLRG
ncbi:Uncharacterised protein [Mycobacteroides abscessus subsp. abscessus]|nr:Uncharacterised protein [Mycobacteroides abscessus subsp. abscessus]